MASSIPATDSAREDLLVVAYCVDVAPDLEAAWQAYSLGRRRFYDLDEAVQNDDGVRAAWSQVLASMELASDRFATPITPLVVFA